MSGKAWFLSDSNIQTVKPQELAFAIGDKGFIQLPSFQRDAVWNEQQIELLWDSILRGYPIGSLIFSGTAHFTSGTIVTKGLQDTAVTAAKNTQPIAADTKYLIIDGQQRAIAVRLGHTKWMPGAKSRLWIDIGGSEARVEPNIFYVCNIKHPWGRDATNHQIAQVQSGLGLKNPEAVFDRKNEDLLGITWPLRAKCPVPLADFLSTYEGQKHNWPDLIPQNWSQKRIAELLSLSIDQPKLAEWQKSLLNFDIPINLILDMIDIEDLGEAFERLNNQGTRMSQAELFYSGLKMHWPEAHDLVWQIYGDLSAGKFLEPIEIVHSVVRLAVAKDSQGQQGDVPELTLKDFKRLIGSNPTSNAFVGKIKDYLTIDSALGIGRFHAILRQAKSMIQYDPVENPIGLPLPALSLLPAKFWHTITAWIDGNLTDTTLLSNQQSKLNMLQYALFERLFVGSPRNNRANSMAFSIASKTIGSAFPSAQILNRYFVSGILGNDFKLPSPKEYEASLQSAWAGDKPLMQYSDSIILFWVQREVIHSWFQGYDPTLYFGSEDLPYDVDHLIAGSKFQHVRNKHGDFDKAFNTNQLHNSAGNLRIWPKSLNRADQDANIEYKGLLGDAEKFFPEVDLYDAQIAYLTSRPFFLQSFGEVRKASAFPENDVELWREAASLGNERNWTSPKRIEAVVKAITRRSVYLYEQIYIALGWENWKKAALNEPWFADLSDFPGIRKISEKEMNIYAGIS